MGVLLDVLCFGILWVPVALIAIVGGVVGLVLRKRRKDTIWLVALCAVGVGACMLAVVIRNRFFPEYPPKPTYHLVDEQLKPFVSAINQANPSSLGFTPIPPDAKITIYEGEDPICQGELSISIIPFVPESATSSYAVQYICFQKVGNEYRWIGELEGHTFMGETLEIRYGTIGERYYYRDPSTQSLIITYRGKDPRLQKSNLTLEDVRPILTEWEVRRLTSTPQQ